MKKKIECPVSVEELTLLFKNSYSYMSIARQLKLNTKSESYMRILKRWQSENNIDSSHFTGLRWSKGKTVFNEPRIHSKLLLSKLGPNTFLETDVLKKIMLYELHFPYECAVCKINTWQEKSINLQIDHIDGDNTNSSKNNIRFICPNCHSQTETYCRGHKHRKGEQISDELFVEALKSSKNIRQALISLGISPKGANYNRAYELSAKYHIEFSD